MSRLADIAFNNVRVRVDAYAENGPSFLAGYAEKIEVLISGCETYEENRAIAHLVSCLIMGGGGGGLLSTPWSTRQSHAPMAEVVWIGRLEGARARDISLVATRLHALEARWLEMMERG
jgi:hypothetical protein